MDYPSGVWGKKGSKQDGCVRVDDQPWVYGKRKSWREGQEPVVVDEGLDWSRLVVTGREVSVHMTERSSESRGENPSHTIPD